MKKDESQLNSLKTYIEGLKDVSLKNDEVFNSWVKAENIELHDANTIIYYLNLIPMIRSSAEYTIPELSNI